MATRSTGNLRYVMRLWGASIALIALSLIPYAFGEQRSGALPALLIGVGVTFVLVVAVRMYALRRVAREFLAPGPEGLIEHSKRALARARVPHARELLALGMASARTLYGQFGRARDELDELVWDELPDLYRGGMLQVRALIHYLSRDDAAAGLRMAREAVELVRLPRFTPGAARSARFSATYVDIGRVLAEGASAELADALSARIRQTGNNPHERLVTIWGAAMARHGLGQTAEASGLFAQVKQLAPHCRPLHEEALRDRPAAGAEHEPERGACARHPELAAAGRCVRCGGFMCDACTRRVSSSAAVCADCHERYREQRENYLRAESHLRTAGLFAQTVAALGTVVLVLLGGWLASDPGRRPLLVLCPAIAMWSLIYWLGGRTLRQLDMSFRPRVVAVAVPLLAVIPLGTIGAGYVWWLAFGPSGRVIHSLDHQRAIAATPELNAPPRWRLVAIALCLLGLNAALLVWSVWANAQR